MCWGHSRLILGSGLSSPKTFEGLRPVILAALKLGINSFDTAPSYRTEHVLGAVIMSIASELGLTRKDYYVQTKIDAWQMMEGNITKHVNDAVSKLGSEYLDALLIHWPLPEKMNNTWPQMSALKSSGLVKNIGICNVRMRQFRQIVHFDTKPDIIQLERNPLRTCEAETVFCLEHNIELQSYSPLCKMHSRLRDNASVLKISQRYHKTAGQVILRWNIDTGGVPIFATHKPERVKEYAEVMDFELEQEDIDSLSKLNCNHKMYLESWACPGF